MMNKKTLIRSLAVAGLLTATGVAQATITVYTSLASFTAAVQNPGTDSFANVNPTGPVQAPATRTTTGAEYGYNVDSVGGLFGAGTTANPWLSTLIATDRIVFNSFTGGVGALGGNFFGSNLPGDFLSGDLVVTAVDASGSVSRTITGATLDSFLGFVSSSGSLISASVETIQPADGGFIWPTVDNLVLASAVPEPESYALLLAGLGIVGFMARRRRAD